MVDDEKAERRIHSVRINRRLKAALREFISDYGLKLIAWFLKSVPTTFEVKREGNFSSDCYRGEHWWEHLNIQG
ncbi:MAG: hypothetical protein RMK18_05680 [Armatimonadota bacterium]|nr:hypothetical protein [Armatimonadota bacterium]MCX7777772.1 hypothetical protein [Armatimonadota bacterium]MDW8025341.1 hypothetical protein [Armatimonadota bacterium]